MQDKFYGSPEQQSVVRRAYALWPLVRDDPRFCLPGRVVSITEEQQNTVELVTGIARLIGYSSCHFVPRGNIDRLVTGFEAAGMDTTIWNQYWGRETALTASREFLASYTPPDGLTMQRIDEETPEHIIDEIAATSIASGVLTAPTSTLRGQSLRSVMLYVIDERGRVVASGGGVMAYHPDSGRGDEAFWGMLATSDRWRGYRLAGWIGAQAIQDLAERFGARGFSSGVMENNASSQALCSRMGVNRGDYVYVSAVDQTALGGKAITR